VTVWLIFRHGILALRWRRCDRASQNLQISGPFLNRAKPLLHYEKPILDDDKPLLAE
jgi:hypothetical protein